MLIQNISRMSMRLLGTGKVPLFNRITGADNVSEIICDELQSDKPTMIARYGYTELICIINYLGVRHGRPNMLRYLLGMELDWWWRPNTLRQIAEWSGFFPPTIPAVERFCEMMLKDSADLDILISWLPEERRLEPYIGARKYVQGLFIDPFWAERPWTRILKGKKVLVVHPFADLIQQQYRRHRQYLFENSEILPSFSLRVLPAVQSLGGVNTDFEDWFSALEYMKREISKIDFDICLLGCGAYGFPLSAFVKRIGKKAVHMGGSLQLLFGIIGRRWEDADYGAKELGKRGCYPSLINDYWVRPGEDLKPQNAENVENACYW